MIIEPTCYEREDGVRMHRLPNRNWALYRTGPGPTWVLCPATGRWTICVELTSQDIETMSLPFDRAYRLLETVKKDDPR